MKKTLIILVLIFCALNLPIKAQAQEIKISVPAEEITPSPAPTPEGVDYELPYPGILPSSPFYTLKLIREGISDLLISDPVEKSNFYLFQADKRVAAFVLLFENGEEQLGEETLSKGIDYLEKSVEKMEDAKKGQADVMDVYGKINSSLKKQKEEIEKNKETKNEEISQKLIKDYERVEELEKKVKAFNP